MPNNNGIMGLDQTATGVTSENQSNHNAVDLFDWLWDGETGTVAIAWDKAPDKRYRGCKPGDKRSRCPGKDSPWCHGRCDSTFREGYYAWPDKRDSLVRRPDSHDSDDMWFAPVMYRESKDPKTGQLKARRRLVNALPTRAAFADLDHASDWTDEQRRRISNFVETFNAAVVRSGSGDNVHIYVRLAVPLDAHQIETLNRRIAAHLGGDPSKVDASSLLRFPGTRNLKPGAGTVRIDRLPGQDSPRVDFSYLDAILPEVPKRERNTLVGESRGCAYETGHPAVVNGLMRGWLKRLQAIEPGDTDKGADVVCYKVAFMGGQWIGGGELNEEHFREWFMSNIPDDVDPDHAEWKLGHGIGNGIEKPLNYDEWNAARQAVDTPTTHEQPAPQTETDDVNPETTAPDQAGAEQPKDVDTATRDYRRSGYLVKGPSRINNYPHWASIKTKEGTEMKKVDGKAWSNFDLEAVGVYTRDDEVEAYLVRVTVEDDEGPSAPVVLPIETLADSRKLRLWLSKRRAHIDRVAKSYGDEPSAAMPNEVRLQKYLDAQNPPILRLVDYVGWQAEHRLFLTPTGIIRPGVEGIQPFAAVSPSEFAIDNSRCHYGTEVSAAEAVDVFRQYLTFHEETVASVVGSWLVMLVLRGQYSASMFPYLHVEGLAESSKTHFLRMGLQLVGQTHKGGAYSPAAAENNYSTHANGVVWVDDNDGLSEPVQALIRQAATGGEKAKMRTDNFSKTRSMEFRAATVVSSEGLTKRFNDQKANRDRAIRLKFPKVVDRPSKLDPNQLQWVDVRALWMDRWGKDFTRVAGSLVSAILALSAEVEIAAEAKRTHQGLAIVQAGAKILSKLTEDSEHQVRVDKWVAEQIENDLGNASLVTLEVIPAVWRDQGFPKSVSGNGIAIAVYWDESTGTFNVNAAKLADKWKEINRGGSSRTESLTDSTAVTRELDAIGAAKSQSHKTGMPKGKEPVLRYREIPATYSSIIDEAARG